MKIVLFFILLNIVFSCRPINSHGQKIYSNLKFALKHKGRVKHFSLKNKGLTTFPNEVLTFSELEILDLSSNLLTQIPPSISQLKKLKVLILVKNHIKFLPKEITHLKNLEQLHLWGNELESLPNNIMHLRKLKKLSIAYNLISNKEALSIKKKLPNCDIWYYFLK